MRPHCGASAALKAPAAGLRPRPEPKGGRQGWHSTGTHREGNERCPHKRPFRHNADCVSALVPDPSIVTFALTAAIARSCRESFRVRASISPRRSKLSWSRYSRNKTSSDRVQRERPRGCDLALALALIAMRSARAAIWRSIRSRCAFVWRRAVSIRRRSSKRFMANSASTQ